MIRELLRPKTIHEALALKEQHGNQAVYMANGTRINAAPYRTECKVAISLFGLELQGISKKPQGWKIGAMTTLQQVVDYKELPEGLRESAALVFSRNQRNQATLGGEIAANHKACQIIPTLLAMGAQVELAEGSLMTVEAWQQAPQGLITRVIIPESLAFCHTIKVTKSSAGLPIVNASLAVTIKNGKRQVGIALAGVSEKPIRLHDVEAQLSLQLKGDQDCENISRESVEQAVVNTVFPISDVFGSAEYKRHISGVLVGQLVEEYKGGCL
ncbi:putative xanthine dehydrogenase subunit C [invertebrate metagenome]|uniref:Putative xanthine dehydrogenase subunit C n=1 Tax=invertebrate metagenome TaxID=1711999 RepID=A0A2H9T8Q9_9ZZZZ